MTAPDPGPPAIPGPDAEPAEGAGLTEGAGLPDLAPVPDADAVAVAALAVADVTALHGGRHGEVATYLPGRRVLGVRTGPGRAEVHVVAVFGPNVARVADRVRASVQRATPAATVVDVVISDLADQPLERP